MRMHGARVAQTRTMTTGDDRIIARHHVRGVLQDGTAHEATVADVFTFANGRVVRMQAYADPDEVPR
jgi:ketosteroid isomerase-like protein